MPSRTLLAGVLLAAAAAPAADWERRSYVYKRTARCEIKAEVYSLPGARKRPVLFWIHGGALIMGNRLGLENSQSEQLRRYLAAGYTVVSIDYRLAPETKLPGILEDLRDAYRWVRERGPALFGADPSRIVLAGHSAGGYLALMGGVILKPPPRAIASFYGYGDIVGAWYSRPDPFYLRQPAVSGADALAAVGAREIADPGPKSPRGRFYLYCRQQGLWPKLVVGRDPGAEPQAFIRNCPERNVSRRYPPTILLHGDADTDVPCQKSLDMAAALQRHGVRHELRVLPGAGHGFDRAMKEPKISETFDAALKFLLENSR